MKATFLVRIRFDAAAIELEARKLGLSLDQAQQAILSDCENRLHDAVRYRQGVERIGTTYSVERKAS
jgi:hypothetical protein